jgi:hypothetical protein
VQDVPLCRHVLGMSRRVLLAPLAFTLDGTMLLGLAYADQVRDAEELLRIALMERGAVFIGVSLSPSEANEVVAALENAGKEATAFVLGARRERHERRR